MSLQDMLNDIKLDKDTNLLPENLKAGITCLGVEGSMETGIDTSDATATKDSIELGKTAYVNNEKITGTLTSIEPEYYAISIINTGYTDDTYSQFDANDEGAMVWTGSADAEFVQVYAPCRFLGSPEGMTSYSNLILKNPASGYMNMTINMTKPYFEEKMNALASKFGITSDKIVSGNVIFGVEGTAETGGSTEIVQTLGDSIRRNIAVILQDKTEIENLPGVYVILNTCMWRGSNGFSIGGYSYNESYTEEMPSTQSITLEFYDSSDTLVGSFNSLLNSTSVGETKTISYNSTIGSGVDNTIDTATYFKVKLVTE